MIVFKHRVNSVPEAQSLPAHIGVEIDVRYHEDELILTHDPFGHHKVTHITLENYLKELHPESPVILNLKSEGVEDKCIQIMRNYSGRLWFFLDVSMPAMVRLAHRLNGFENLSYGPENLCVRFSEYEAIEYALSFSGKVDWVWIDSFQRLSLTEDIYRRLSQAGMKLCLVSPELQGHPLEMIQAFRKQLEGMNIDAVCTKRPDLWEIAL